MVGTELDRIGGYILKGLGYSYGLRESEMYEHKLSDFLNDTIYYRLAATTRESTPATVEYLQGQPLILSVHPEKNWVVLKPMTGKEDCISLSIKLVERIPNSYTIWMKYNNKPIRILAKTVRDLSVVLGKAEIPIRYWSKV